MTELVEYEGSEETYEESAEDEADLFGTAEGLDDDVDDLFND